MDAHAKDTSYDTILPRMDYFSYRDADASWVIEPSIIPFHDISYVMEGEAAYDLDGQSVTVHRGDLLYIPPGTFREASLTGAQRYKVYAMNFHLQDIQGRLIHRLPFAPVTSIGIHPDLISFFKSLSTAWLLQETGYRLTVRALMELVISKLLDLAVYKNSMSAADLRVRQVVEYIAVHHDQPLTLQFLADMVQLSPTYLSALFRQCMGITLSRYMNMIRVNHAESLLMNGMCNVTEASECCGFCDVYYFSRVFTELKGYNPKDIIGKHSGG